MPKSTARLLIVPLTELTASACRAGELATRPTVLLNINKNAFSITENRTIRMPSSFVFSFVFLNFIDVIT